jgi:hypothetical protein
MARATSFATEFVETLIAEAMAFRQTMWRGCGKGEPFWPLLHGRKKASTH